MTHSLMHPAPVYNVDGTLNKAGSICSVVDLILHFQNHLECAIFAVTNLGKHKMILGYPWLWDHNPEVDWQTQQVTLNQCPAKCHICRAKVCQEQQEAVKICACRVRPIPKVADEDEEEPGGFKTFLGPGDHLFTTVCSAPKATIAVVRNMATELAEKALCSTPAKKADLIPHYLCDFEEVFTKKSFDSLPEKHSWDHAIELEPGSKPSTCKVYPLTPNEQVQLDISCKRTSTWVRSTL